MPDPRPHAPLSAVIAVDIGGTTLKSAIIDSQGTVLHHERAGSYSTNDDPLESLTHLIRRLATSASARRIGLQGIGLASPGVIDDHRGEVVYAANLRWRNLLLAEVLENEFSLPVALDHDARAGAIAETAALQGETAPEDFIFVPIGTGVSAAVVVAGSPVRGATGGAGEFGHMPVVLDGEGCNCGGRGCIEAYASASTVLARYRARGGTAATSTPELVARLGVDGDARAVWQDLVQALAIGLSSLTAVLDPARIVIGGGLSNAGSALLAPLATEMSARVRWRDVPPLHRSAAGTHASLIGAALIAFGRDLPPAREFALATARNLQTATRRSPISD